MARQDRFFSGSLLAASQSFPQMEDQPFFRLLCFERQIIFKSFDLENLVTAVTFRILKTNAEFCFLSTGKRGSSSYVTPVPSSDTF